MYFWWPFVSQDLRWLYFNYTSAVLQLYPSLSSLYEECHGFAIPLWSLPKVQTFAEIRFHLDWSYFVIHCRWPVTWTVDQNWWPALSSGFGTLVFHWWPGIGVEALCDSVLGIASNQVVYCWLQSESKARPTTGREEALDSERWQRSMTITTNT